MHFKLVAVLSFLISGCSNGQSDNDGTAAEAQSASEGRVLTAVVTGFGGPGSRRGFTNVYIRSGELTGVIPGVLPEELDCKVGDRIPARRSGGAIVALKNACRKPGIQGPLTQRPVSTHSGHQRRYGNYGWKAVIRLDYVWCMSLKGFFAGQSDDGNPMKAQEALLHHVNGTGTGYEVDDLLTWSPTPEQERKAILPLHEINDRYSCDEYPIGIANPASFGKIRVLAERLRSEGL